MLMELGPIEKLYQSYEKILDKARKNLGRDLTVVEKNLFAHLPEDIDYSKLERGVSDIFLKADRVAMQMQQPKWQFFNLCPLKFLRLQYQPLSIAII